MIHLKKNLPQEKVLLIGLQTPKNESWEVEESLQELAELVRSAGGKAAHIAIQHLDKPTAPFYIGKGKAAELAAHAKKESIKTIIFDDELSPAQTRNLEKTFGCKVLDRTQLILDVFARRAKTKEGKLQIELAQLQYLLPRLTRMWTHLSRQTGGIGTRGPGETQLEVDRRRVGEKIGKLKQELEAVKKHRKIQREGRNRFHWPICSLVGYTNAGKSTLMNRLTNARVFVADQLFATLDPTIRQFRLPHQQRVLISDTVGFLKKLPHHLVESFKATLEEVVEADLLLHIVDISNPQFEEQMHAVDVVLEEIHATGKPTLIVFNKIDLLENNALLKRYLAQHPDSVGISAKTNEGIGTLFFALEKMLKNWHMQVKLRLPQSEGHILAEIHRTGRIIEEKYEENDIIILANIPPQLHGRLKKYILS